MKHDFKYVNSYKDRHGKRRCYYRRDGQSQRIDGEIGSSEWIDNYNRIHKGFERPDRPVTDHGSLDFAIEEYLRSDRYGRLAGSSQRVYSRALDEVRRALGKRALADFTRGNINSIRDTIAKRAPSMAVLTVKALSAVFEHARDCDLIDRNPAKNIIKPAGFKAAPHRPWAEAELSLVFNQGDPFIRRAVTVLLYTGLRASDAVELTRGSIRNHIIRTITIKTKRKVSIPLHSKLEAEISSPLPVESIYLVPGRKGQKMTVVGLSAAIKRQFIALGYEDRPPMHGLRKNAVMSLIEAGCEPRQIQAITGQSLEMIEHYGQDYERDRLAIAAIHKLERKK